MSDPKLQSASASLNLFCDLDRDGDPDLVVGNAGTPEPFRDIGSGPFVSVNDGFGNFRMLDQAVIPEEYTWHLSYACADLNQDGWQDLLISNEETGDARQLQLLYNEGGMSFREVTQSVLPPGGDARQLSRKQRVMDLNGDGFPEIIPAAIVSQPQTILWSTGGESFVAEGLYPPFGDSGDEWG